MKYNCDKCSDIGLICKVNGLCSHNNNGCNAKEPCEGMTRKCNCKRKGQKIISLMIYMVGLGISLWILLKIAGGN